MAGSRLETGMTVDGFLVGDLIHQGGMATLRSVTHPDFDLPLLMKVPRMVEGTDVAAIVGFEMELMIVPRLSGIHVPRFIAAGELTVLPYLVMERIPGRSLLPLLDQLPLPPTEVAAIGSKVALALNDLHRQHVVHLDVKPSNVVIRDSGEAALVDFGLSHHEQLPDLLQEQFRVPYGTAPYMAPEQVMGERGERRSDLFALGVLLYFFATGVRPFGDPKGRRGLQKRLWRDPVPPRQRRPEIPPWLQEIILRCLEVDPSRRHPTAAQLAFDLAHPDQVKLTVRAEKLAQDPWTAVLRRRFNRDDQLPPRDRVAAGPAPAAPIVGVAIDLASGGPELAELLRITVRRILDTVPGARLACLNVLEQHRLTLDQTLDEEGHNKLLKRLNELKHWAQPLSLEEQRISFHVLEATDPAAALLDYARTNLVDHLVLGARETSGLRRLLGSVSAEVVAKAPCTVTVVRPRQAPEGH